MNVSGLLTSLALMSVLTHGFCSESPLSGIYIFADVGREHSKTTTKREQSNVKPIEFFVGETKSYTDNRWFGGGGAGVSTVFNDIFYLAAEINVNGFNNINNSKGIYLAKNSVDVLIKPGYVFPTNTAVYGQAGIGMNKINYNSPTYQCGKADGCGPNTFVFTTGVNKYVSQYLLGGGVRQALTESLSISIEAQYVKQSQYDTSGATFSPENKIYNFHGTSVRTQSVQGLLKLNYIIGHG